MIRSFRTVAATAIGAAIAFTPSIAAGAVPYAGWYWSLAVPTSNPNVLLLGTSKGVYRSSDAGKTWQSAGLSGVDTEVSSKRAMRSSPAGHASDRARNPSSSHGAYSVTPGPAVIAVSTNAGASWRELHPLGLPNVGVQALAVDPADSRAIDAVLRTGAIYRTTDGAHSFRRISLKAGGTPWALAIAQNNQLVAGDMTTGAYLGTSAQQWQHTAFVDSQGGHMVMEYAVQPTDLTRVLMTSYGIELSTDGAKSWHVVLKSKVMFGPIAWAPKSPDLAYAVGWDHSVWRSADGGKTWKHIA